MNSFSISQLSEALQALTDEQLLSISPQLDELSQETVKMLNEDAHQFKVSFTDGEPFEIGCNVNAEIGPTQSATLKAMAKQGNAPMPPWMQTQLPEGWLDQWVKVEGNFLKWLSENRNRLNHFVVNPVNALESYASGCSGQTAEVLKSLLKPLKKAIADGPSLPLPVPGVRLDEVKININPSLKPSTFLNSK